MPKVLTVRGAQASEGSPCVKPTSSTHRPASALFPVSVQNQAVFPREDPVMFGNCLLSEVDIFTDKWHRQHKYEKCSQWQWQVVGQAHTHTHCLTDSCLLNKVTCTSILSQGSTFWKILKIWRYRDRRYGNISPYTWASMLRWLHQRSRQRYLRSLAKFFLQQKLPLCPGDRQDGRKNGRKKMSTINYGRVQWKEMASSGNKTCRRYTKDKVLFPWQWLIQNMTLARVICKYCCAYNIYCPNQKGLV